MSYRDLFWTISVHRLKVRYKQSILGVSWALFQPLALMLIYTVIFSFIARLPSDGAPYALFAYTALLPWTFFSTVLTNATNGLVGQADLITKVYFPREILPLTYIAVGLFDLAIASTVLFGLMIFYDVPLRPMALYAVPIVGLLTLLLTGLALFLSATQVRFRDVGMAMPLGLQLWMFASPVVYPLSAIGPKYEGLYMLNPMVGIIESFRRVILHGAPPAWEPLLVSAVTTMLLLPPAYIYFKHVEATVADII